MQFIRHSFPVAFIGIIHFMSERFFPDIKSHNDIIRLDLGISIKKNVQKSVDCIRMKAIGIGKRRNPIKSSVNNAVAVDQ